MIAVVSPVTDDLLRQYDVSGPRYTSYPTADRFVEAFVAADYSQALTQRRSGPAALALACNASGQSRALASPPKESCNEP